MSHNIYNIFYLLQNDLDGYVSNFSHFDLCARKCKDKSEYINNMFKDFYLTSSESTYCKERLNKFIPEADKKLSKLSKDFSKIDWDIVLFRGNHYENGISHTRFKTIFLPLRVFEYSDEKFIRLLCHEKIHVFQRMFPDHILVKNYMKNYKKITHCNNFSPLVRSNPDMDGFIYSNSTGEIMCYLYASDNPSSINDVKMLSHFEHPFEQMAIEWSK